jgi:rod shape-determining protein MreD
MATRSATALAIMVTLIMAMILTILPIADWARAYRPLWIPLVLVYWTMALPRTIGVGIAWFVGLYMDATLGTLLGQHAAGYAITAYISMRFHQRTRVYPLGQQALAVGLMLLPYMSLTLWAKGIRGQAPDTWLYWAPLLSSMLVWPLLFLILRKIRRQAANTH